MMSWIPKLRPAGATLALASALAATPAPAEEPSPALAVSATVRINKGSYSGREYVLLPECPGDLRFMAREVHAGSRNLTYACNAWAVWVSTFQHYSAGPTQQVPLIVVGRGPAHATASLVAGMDADYGNAGPYAPGRMLVWAFCDSEARADIAYEIHVGGYCGKPSSLGIIHTVP